MIVELLAAIACAGTPNQMLCLHNQVRRQHGLAPLRVDRRLSRSARLKANRVVACDQFSHTPCGDPWDRTLRMVGMSPTRGYGENQSVGYGTRWAMKAWMLSPSHRRNILAPRWRRYGSFFHRGWRLWVVHFAS